jgi:DNA-binding protein
MTDIDTIYIGNKPAMRYVLAIINAFGAGGVDNLVVKARGRAISRAVDVVEISRNRFLKDVEAGKIEIGTEELPAMGGGTRGVSTIAITMTKIGEKQAPEPEAEVEEPKVEAVEPKEEAEEAKAEVEKPKVEAEEPKAEKKESKAEPKSVAPKRRLELAEIKGVGQATEEKLKEAGYKTVNSVAKADPAKLSKKAGISEKIASKLIDSAKELVK